MRQIGQNIIVESKKNNSELIKAVRQLEDNKNQYIIVYDNSFDNLQVYQEQKLLRRYADKKENVFLLDLICFEYTLLEFDQLIQWIYAPEDEFLVKRSRAVKAREANSRLSLKAKMESIYKGTSIRKEFSKTGLEVLL